MHDYSGIVDRLGFYARAEHQQPGPLPESVLANAEAELGCRLPEDYRDFLLQYGGNGYLRSRHLLGSQLGQEGIDCPVIDVLYGYRPGELFDLVNEWDAFRERIPRELVPIGVDGGRDQYCLSIAGKDRGAIFFWDAEDEPAAYFGPPPMPDIWSNCTLYAHSFAEFLEALFIDDSP